MPHLRIALIRSGLLALAPTTAQGQESLIRNMKPRADGSIVMPWLLDVELGGECRTAFEADDKLRAGEPRHGLLPPKEPGYGTVRRRNIGSPKAPTWELAD